MKLEVLENVIARLEVLYPGFSEDLLDKSADISEFNDVNSLYFHAVVTIDGISICIGDIVLYSEDVDGSSKCYNEAVTSCVGCGVCIDYTAEDIFNICLVRLKGLKDILTYESILD